MLLRLAIAVFCVVIMGVQITTTKWYIFLTNWAFLLLTLAFVGLSLVSVIYVIQQCKKESSTTGETQETYGSASERDVEVDSDIEEGLEKLIWYQKTAWFLWIISANAGVIVTIMYWAVIFTPPTNFRDVSVHALNSLFVLIELFMGSIPVRLLHVVYVMILASIYSIFAVVYWAAGGVNDHGQSYIYKVIDFENGNAGVAAGILIATVFLATPLIQLLLFGLYNLRCYFKKIISPNSEGDEGYTMKQM